MRTSRSRLLLLTACAVVACGTTDERRDVARRVRATDPRPSRERVIPAAAVGQFLAGALAGTVIQISHTGGEPATLPGLVRRRATAAGAGDECLGFCAELAADEQAACRARCDDSTAAAPVCSPAATVTTSYVRWGAAAQPFAARQRCDATSCPACATPGTSSTLADQELAVPTFRREIAGLPGAPLYTSECALDRWRFVVDDGVTVTSAPSGITLHIPGATGAPAVRCDNMPDARLAAPALAITFRFPWRALPTLVVDAELEGTLDGELADEIRARVAEHITRRLNEQPQRAALQRMFRELIARGAGDGAVGRITTDGGGLRVSD